MARARRRRHETMCHIIFVGKGQMLSVYKKTLSLCRRVSTKLEIIFCLLFIIFCTCIVAHSKDDWDFFYVALLYSQTITLCGLAIFSKCIFWSGQPYITSMCAPVTIAQSIHLFSSFVSFSQHCCRARIFPSA